jgi:hypothetical protein
LSYSGVEWDYAHFGNQHYFLNTPDDWDAIRTSIEMQVSVSRRAWPGLHGIFLRTQNPTPYKWGTSTWIANDSSYFEFSELQRGIVAADGQARESVCGALQVLDLAAMLNCTEQGHAPQDYICHEWTRDYLHHWPFVYGQFWSMAVNVLADAAEACIAALGVGGGCISPPPPAGVVRLLNWG